MAQTPARALATAVAKGRKLDLSVRLALADVVRQLDGHAVAHPTDAVPCEWCALIQAHQDAVKAYDVGFLRRVFARPAGVRA